MSCRPFRLRMDSLPPMTTVYASWIMRSQMALASSGSANFSGQPGMTNWEQKIVEFRLYRDSTIF